MYDIIYDIDTCNTSCNHWGSHGGLASMPGRQVSNCRPPWFDRRLTAAGSRSRGGFPERQSDGNYT